MPYIEHDGVALEIIIGYDPNNKPIIMHGTRIDEPPVTVGGITGTIYMQTDGHVVEISQPH